MRCEGSVPVTGVPGLARWVPAEPAGTEPATAKPAGTQGAPRSRSEQQRRVLVSRCPPHRRDPGWGAGTGRGCGTGLLRSRCAAGAGRRDGPGGQQRSGRTLAIGALTAAGGCPLPPGAAVPGGRIPACRCWGWQCHSHWRAASPCQEHADLPGISPQWAPHVQVSARPGNVAPALGAGSAPGGAERLDRGMGGCVCALVGTWWVLAVSPPCRTMQHPAGSPCPATPVHVVFLVLGGPDAMVRGCVSSQCGGGWGVQGAGGLCARGGGSERLGVLQCWGEGECSEAVAWCPHPRVLQPSPLPLRQACQCSLAHVGGG